MTFRFTRLDSWTRTTARHDQSSGSGRPDGSGSDGRRPDRRRSDRRTTVEPARKTRASERLLTHSPYFQGPLYELMSEDLHLAGMARRTHEGYLRAVRSLADFCRRTPDQISEDQLRKYFLHLLSQKAGLAVPGLDLLAGRQSRSATGPCLCAVPGMFPVRRSSKSAGHQGRLRSRCGWQSPRSSTGTGQSCHRLSGQRIALMTRLRQDQIRIFQTRCQPCRFAVRAECDFGPFSRECRPTRTRISRRNDQRKAISSPQVELGGHFARVSGRTTRPSRGSISHTDRAFRERLSRDLRLSRRHGQWP